MEPVLYMDAVITPNRSLSQRGFVVLICVVTALNCLSALVFVARGATLVPIFLGLDVSAVILAFMASYRAAKKVERVQVSAREVRVIQETPRWTRVIWESPTAFTRVATSTMDDVVVELKLALSGKDMPVAQALSPGERADFAKALETAIYAARRERG
jgi:uncharacterized membrane protein